MITIVYDNNHIDIDLNVIFSLPEIDMKNVRLKREDLRSVAHMGTYIQVNFLSEKSPYQCNLNGAGGSMPIGSINGVTSQNIDELYDLLKNMVL